MDTISYQGLQSAQGELRKTEDVLTVEEALQIELNGEVFTVTMQTPGHEIELIRGLLHSEGILSTEDIANFEILETNPLGHIKRIDVQIVGKDFSDVIDKRSLLSAASCGICGNRELEFPTGDGLSDSFSFSPSELEGMYIEMQKGQIGFIASGGSHAAAIFNKNNELLCLREDVGRHNAVDKVVGALLLEHKLGDAAFLLVSGRLSYEIVAKCFKARIPVLAAVSAPSSLAVDMAKELGVTLIAFCRDDRCTCYAFPNRIKPVNSQE